MQTAGYNCDSRQACLLAYMGANTVVLSNKVRRDLNLRFNIHVSQCNLYLTYPISYAKFELFIDNPLQENASAYHMTLLASAFLSCGIFVLLLHQ